MKVILSAAVSLDGYLDDLSPRRLKLSSAEDWAAVGLLRTRCDAILVGAETVRKDNPSLVIKDENLRTRRVDAGMNADIVKVVVSGSGKLDPGAKFFTEGNGHKIVFTLADSLPELVGQAEIITCKKITAAVIRGELETRGYKTLMVEGGSGILTMFLTEGIADEFRLAVAPLFVGEPEAPRLVGSGVFPWDKDHRMRPAKVELLGDTTVIYLRPGMTDNDRKFMKKAVEEAFRCTPSESHYCVGAVIVTMDGNVFSGYTGATETHNHAEEEAIIKALAVGVDLRGSTIYSSMEPCSCRSSKPKSCSELIVEHGFSKVVYALKEPPHFVKCNGDDLLRKAGVEVVVLDEFAPQVLAANAHLTDKK